MKQIAALLAAVAITIPAVAGQRTAKADGDERKVRTVVIRDGKVISGERELPELLPFHGRRAYLGVHLIDMTRELREHYGAPANSGLLVGSVKGGAPAAKAGVRVGDIVVAVDGKDVASIRDLRRALAEKEKGDSIRIEVIRDRARQALVATVAEREATLVGPGDIDIERITRRLDDPEWRARIESGNWEKLQTRIRELEARLKELEKKLK